VSSSRPLILVTNDDGVSAPGITALAEALRGVAEVVVAAPDRERSATSHSISLDRPLRVDQLHPDVFSIDGTPVDCVYLALLHLVPRRPDLCVSGINHGYNLGSDVFYSGTVAGAREGTFFGVPSLAFSLAARAEHDFAPAAAFAAKLAPLVLDKGLPERTLLNVNVPPGTPTGAVVTVQGRREHEGTIMEGLDPRRRTFYWIEEGRDRWVSDEMSDITAVRNGYISISPLQTDTTHHQVMAAFKPWEAALRKP